MYKTTTKAFFNLVLLLFFTQIGYSQLSNFNLNVVKTDETCTANGTLNFSVSNTTAGATIIFTIYHLPDAVTPIAVQNTTSFSGLVAGSYRVVATQSLGSLTNSQQQDVTILNQIVLLTYSISGNNEICGADGKITVNVLTGTPVSYEIFAGPIIRPLQSSNIFTDLVAGQYSIRVFDSCGEGVVQNFTIFLKNHNVYIDFVNNYIVNCGTITNPISLRYGINEEFAFPLSIQYIVHPPAGGSDIVYNQTVNFSSTYPLFVDQNIIFFPNQNYECDVIITDACGSIYGDTRNMYRPTNPFVTLTKDCDLYTAEIINQATNVVLLGAPIGYTGPVPYTIPSGTTLYNLIAGIYTVSCLDICGQPVTFSFPVGFDAVLEFANQPGCDIGYGSVSTYNNPLETIIITAAPASFNYALPYDVSFNIVSDGRFYMNSLPAGMYNFFTVDRCGVENDYSVFVQGLIENYDFNIIEHCGSFDVQFTASSTNNNYSHKYFLQKYNPITNEWFNPSTGNVYYGQELTPANSIVLSTSFINYNNGYTGAFRIVEQFRVFGNGSSIPICLRTLYEFEFTGQPKINDVYSFLCDNGNYDVFVDAVGFPPLTYRITQKNGSPFIVDNGNSSVFLQLEAATYNFQVEDACGNILNSNFEVPRPFVFGITPQNLCESQLVSLTVPNFSIFNYEWWKDNDVSNILSTTNSLDFPNFNLVASAGVYHVRISYTGNPNSCIDFILDYTIELVSVEPNAGQDGFITYCGNQGDVDLFSLLQGNYDNGGTWYEINANQEIQINSIWNSSNALPGVYYFKYKLDVFCTFFDEAVIEITIKPIPQTPDIVVEPEICEAQNLYLYTSSNPDVIYNWTGPNGFVSNEQNPIITDVTNINSGTYTLVISKDGCDSDSASVEVVINSLPIANLETYCENSNFMLAATPNNVSYTYAWTGPNGFSSSANPVDITNENVGDYFLTVTSPEGCSKSESINIDNTLCFITNVITPNGDNSNQSFNLNGLSVANLKVFNRWGRLIYEKENYIDEWHGQNNNDGNLPDGTYYYFATLNSGTTKSGWVFIHK